MANLTETSTWEAGVYQLETGDPVLGGPGGIANQQAQQLLNRSKFLRDRLDNVLIPDGTKVDPAKIDGLGSAALLAAGTGAGQVMPVGAFGLGADCNVCTDCDSFSSFKLGFNIVPSSAANRPSAESLGGLNGPVGHMIVFQGADSGNQLIQILFIGNRIYWRRWDTDTFFPWTFVSGADDIGMVTAFAHSTVPDGWLKCNGAAVSRSTYGKLFARIGTTYGAGNGSTTFNLPDLRGEFVRGWDNGRGIDAGRAIGTAQADDFKTHKHLFRDVQTGPGSLNGFDLPPAVTGTSGFSSSDNVEDYGGNETRPRNIALMYCIKYQ